MTTWKKEIAAALVANEESWADVEAFVPSMEALEIPFDDGYGGTNGVPFTVWTKNHVYFPICYDGAEWVGQVARNPDGIATKHQGGG